MESKEPLMMYADTQNNDRSIRHKGGFNGNH